MTPEEVLAHLIKLSHPAKVFFVESSPDVPTHGGFCRISDVSESGFTVTFDGKSFVFPLGASGVYADFVSLSLLPEATLKHLPEAARSRSGILIVAPGGRSLFLLGMSATF